MTATTVVTPRCLLGIDDLPAGSFDALVDLAAVMRRHPLAWRGALEGRAVACVFERPSTRRRVSLEVAVHRLGALPVVLGGRDDSIAETARLLSSYCEAIVVRTDRHRDLLELAEHAAVPVLNAGTDREDPCRALADCLMLRERFGELAGLQVAYIGAFGPVAHSLIEAAMLAGMTVRVATPPALRLDPALLARAGDSVIVCETPREAASGAVEVFGPDRGTATPELLPVEQAVLHALVTGDWEV